MYFHPEAGGGGNGWVQCPWGFPCFFGGHLPQTSGFRSAKEILVVSFATQPRAFILSDRNIFYTPGGGRTTAGSNAPGASLVIMFFWWSLAPDPRFLLGQTFTCCKLADNARFIFGRLALIRHNLQEGRCRKFLGVQCHQNLFDESKDKDASKF